MLKAGTIILGLLILSPFLYAQCNKNVTWHSGKMELLKPSGDIEDSKEEVTIIEGDKEKIIIRAKNNDDNLTFKINETNCEWEVPFVNGKSVYKGVMTKPNGETSDATVTIEGKDGKLNILLDLVKMDGKKIRLVVFKFEEKQGN